MDKNSTVKFHGFTERTLSLRSQNCPSARYSATLGTQNGYLVGIIIIIIIILTIIITIMTMLIIIIFVGTDRGISGLLLRNGLGNILDNGLENILGNG